MAEKLSEITYIRLSPRLRRALENRARVERRRLTEMVRMILEDALLACPQCDSPTTPHPDPTMAGMRYCPHCQESVAYEAGDGKE